MNIDLTLIIGISESVFLSHVHHTYAQTDGSYAWPNSHEGDMLRRAKAEIEKLETEISILNGIACTVEQAAGKGPCGICKKCLRAKTMRNDELGVLRGW